MNNDIEFFIKKFNVSRETIEKLNIYKDFLLENNKLLNLIGKNNRKTCFFKAF
jgi:16S rRNA G527 N7-methylase RsmG